MDPNARLERLERTLCRWRRLAAAGLVSCLLLGALGAQAKFDEVVDAKTFRLRDGAGKVRAVLSMTDLGQPVLRLYDAKGTDRVTVSIAKEGGFLSFNDADAKSRVFLTESGPALYFLDGEGHQRVALFTAKSGTGLNLNDEEGNRRASLGIGPEGPVLSLRDEMGKIIHSKP